MDGLGLLPVSPGAEAPATSIYLWGEGRRDVNYVARIVGRQVDPQFRWVEAAPAASTDEDALAAVGSASSPPAKHPVPDGAVRPELLWSFLLPHSQQLPGFDVNEFFHLPEPVQVAVGALLSRAPPRAVVVANVDVLEEFKAGELEYGRFVEWLNSHEITLIVTAVGEPMLERIGFEYSVMVPSALGEGLRPYLAVCQWGDCTNCLFKQLSLEREVRCSSQPVSDPPVLHGLGVGRAVR
jgi:hypothetical protein